MATDEENRIEELASGESYDVLWNALYAALEADLSGQGWPNSSLKRLRSVAEDVESLISEAEHPAERRTHAH